MDSLSPIDTPGPSARRYPCACPRPRVHALAHDDDWLLHAEQLPHTEQLPHAFTFTEAVALALAVAVAVAVAFSSI